MCILTVVLSSLSIFNKLKISDFIFPLFGRFISGMGPNPVLMELEKKSSTYYYDLYNFTPTKDITIHHTPRNTLCSLFQFMLTIIVLIPNKNSYHLQNAAHFLSEIKQNSANAAKCRNVFLFFFFFCKAEHSCYPPHWTIYHLTFKAH